MKCKSCGSNLTIDDEVCSFCGTANPFAAKHRQQMRHFTREFNKTKSDVLNTSKHQSKLFVKITLIAVMVAVNMIVWFAIGNFYSIESFFNARKINAHYTEHKAVLDEYEENRQYLALAAYYDRNDLYDSDKFDEYRQVVNTCNYYSSIYRNLIEIVMGTEYDYMTKEDKVERISEDLEYMYKYSQPNTYSDEEQYAPVHQACMDDLVNDTEALLQAYFEIPEEDIVQFEALSKAKRQIIMEEGLVLYE